MTREEAINVFKGFKFLPREQKAVDMAIEALEQEPCDDAISRQAVLNIFSNKGEFDWVLNCAVEKIKELPPVIPTRPKGKWIKRWYGSGEKRFCMIVCSECQEEFSYDAETGISMDNYNACPNCGSRYERR